MPIREETSIAWLRILRDRHFPSICAGDCSNIGNLGFIQWFAAMQVL